MRNFHSLPGNGHATGDVVCVTDQNLPVNLISLYPGGGSVCHATPALDENGAELAAQAQGTGALTFRLPARSLKAARLVKAGKP